MPKTDQQPQTKDVDDDAAVADAAVTAAIAEADQDADDAGDNGEKATAPTTRLVSFTMADMTVTFDPRRLDDVRFLRLMQQGRDAVALDLVLGERQHTRLLDALAAASDDGIASQDAYMPIWEKIGKAAGTGNS